LQQLRILGWFNEGFKLIPAYPGFQPFSEDMKRSVHRRGKRLEL